MERRGRSRPTENEESTINRLTVMKPTMILRSLLAAGLLSGFSTVVQAQNATRTCPLGNEPGYGRTLTAEQRAEQCAAVRQQVAELQQKRTQGTLTADEAAWLQQVGQRCGPCVTGSPRGRGACLGQGARNGGGQRQRNGLRDGTGPRNADGTCPSGNVPQQRGRR